MKLENEAKEKGEEEMDAQKASESDRVTPSNSRGAAIASQDESGSKEV